MRKNKSNQRKNRKKSRKDDLQKLYEWKKLELTVEKKKKIGRKM